MQSPVPLLADEPFDPENQAYKQRKASGYIKDLSADKQGYPAGHNKNHRPLEVPIQLRLCGGFLCPWGVDPLYHGTFNNRTNMSGRCRRR